MKYNYKYLTIRHLILTLPGHSQSFAGKKAEYPMY